MSGKHKSRREQTHIYAYACTMCTSCVGSCLCTACLWLPACLLTKPQGTLIVCCNVPRGKNLLAAPPEGCDTGGEGGGGARKPGHISCGNRVIASPITTAITAGGPQESGNNAYRHTDGHTWEGIKKIIAHHTYKNMTNTHAVGVRSEMRRGILSRHFRDIKFHKWIRQVEE